MNIRHASMIAVLSCAGFGFHNVAHAAGTGVAGRYQVEGTNPDGRPYRGALKIEQKGDVYDLTWDSGGINKGVGMMVDSKLVVGYGNAGCGVVAYKRNGGNLDGHWAMPNSTQLGSETATPAQSGSGSLSGDYIVNGLNADKSPYKGALFVSEKTDEKKITFVWRTGPDAQGFGFLSDNLIVGTFGPPSCGVVSYNVAADGSLNGQWAFLHGALGSETAHKTE